jgi:hypothetical protein
MSSTASALLAFLVVLSLAALTAGLALAIRRLALLQQATRIQAEVVSDWCFVRYGRRMRYYRVDVPLSTGQLVQLRSGFALSAARPAVGERVMVLLLERAGRPPQARLGSAVELWLEPALLLALGGLGLALCLGI